MYFEVYADSFLLLQFVMNCYVLALVNSLLRQRVGWKRILGGAFCGAVFSLISFLLPFKVYISVFISFIMSVLWLAVYTFQIRLGKHALKVLEKLGISTILMGGSLVMLMRILPKGMDAYIRVLVILLMGGVICGILIRVIKKNQKLSSICRVTLFKENAEKNACEKALTEGISIEALIDTGNSLVEPISGKPVAILDKTVFEQLFGEQKPSVFRVIPYHSVGKKAGVLPGYRLEHIVVETEEGVREYKDVYVGIGEDVLSEENTYKMILNPHMLE